MTAPRPVGPLPWLDGRALDAVKVWAAVLMVTDHVTSMWFDRRYPLLDMLGRGSFPLFAYASAIAIDRAQDPAAQVRSVGRLLLLAALVEPISRWCRPPVAGVNVLFTLGVGMALAAAWPSFDGRWRAAAVAAAVACTAFLVPMEFSVAGALFPAALSSFARRERGSALVLGLLVVPLNVGDLWNVATLAPPGVLQQVLTRGARDAVVVAVLPLLVVHACKHLPATGRLLPKYFLHVFYPAHLLVLWALAPR
jgi:hypothetical protein